MKFYCPNCKTEIIAENINIATDLAKCQKCNTITTLSDIKPSGQSTIVTSTPPAGSKISITKGISSDYEITLPKEGFTARKIPVLGFTIIWLSFIGFWTFLASSGSIIFAFFSIPFWFVGFSMLYGILKSATTSQKITFNRHQFSLHKSSIFGKKLYEYENNSILAINLSKPLNKNPFAAYSKIGSTTKPNRNLPNLVAPEKNISFFETSSIEDQEWLVKFLNQKLMDDKS